jgi:hypothetical protein
MIHEDETKFEMFYRCHSLFFFEYRTAPPPLKKILIFINKNMQKKRGGEKSFKNSIDSKNR